MGGVSTNCSWIIVAPSPDDRISLTFTYMDLSMDPSCTSNYVELLDGEDFEAPSIYKACVGGIPPTKTSSGNAMILHIVGDHYYGHGFRAVYDLSSSGLCTSHKNIGSNFYLSRKSNTRLK